ncbi:FAD binding domain-containing protein [Stappia sp. ICDLI1TA098]
MKAAPFDYVRVSSFDEIHDIFAAYGDDAQVIAGGQSLVPAMAMRMARPKVLVDIAGLPGLAGIRETADAIEIGAMTRYADLRGSALVARHAPLVHAAVPLIAHEAIRSRGTLGGNLVHADPASEMPAVMLALDATILVTGQAGVRAVPAQDFFLGTYAVDLEPGEIVSAIRVPAARADQRCGIDEFARRAGDYAAVGGAFRIDLEGARIAGARLAFFAVADKAQRARAAEEALAGQSLADLDTGPVLDALTDDIAPTADLHNGVATKRHLMRVLTVRLLRDIATGAGPTHG